MTAKTIAAVGTSDQAILQVRAVCPHDCPDTCAMQVSVSEGKVIRIVGDPAHPTTRGALCTKVARYAQRVYHPERLLSPLKRAGKKGGGHFIPISWEQALREIAARLNEIRARCPESILPYSYAGTMGFVQGEGMGTRFFHRIGASRLERGICSAAGGAGLAHSIGAPVGMDVEAFSQSRLILIWGSNSITSNLHFWSLAQQARREGAWLVAIDPIRTDTARRCDQHIAIRPGTDAALALSIAHVLIERGLVDRQYIDAYTVGYEAFIERARQYPPERAASICGLDAQTIVALALRYAATRPAAIRLNYGMQRVRGGANAVRAVACLPALTGAWRDRAGGLLMSASGHVPIDAHAWLRPDLMPGWPNQLPRLINMSAIGDALLEAEPPIDALIVYNSNPLAVAPDSNRVIKGFSRENLLTVVLEHFQTDTADYADYVLPATTQLEHFDLHKSYGHRYLMANTPAIAPLGQALSNAEIFRRLAAAMGLDDPALRAADLQIARDCLHWQDASLDGHKLQDVIDKGWIKLRLRAAPFEQGGFPTPSGRFEFSSERLHDRGMDPLPDWLAPYESVDHDPELAKRFPLNLISPPARNFLNSTFVNVNSLAAAEGEPACEMHVEDATARGIDDGAMVRLFNDRGSFTVRVAVGDRVRPGVVAAWGVWWQRLSPGGINVNATTSQALTDLGGGATFYDCLVEVSPLA